MNGVVTTLSRTRDALQRAGHGDGGVARAFRTFPARPTPRFGSPSCRAASSRRPSTRSRRTQSTSRPRARSVPARAATASRTDSPSRRRTTRNSRNTFASACRSPKAGPTRTCGTITAARAALWSRRSTSGAISSRTASRTSCCGRAASTRIFSSLRAVMQSSPDGQSGCTRAALRWRRISMHSSRWICRARRSS